MQQQPSQRLLSETINTQVTSYSYDNNGNTLSRFKSASDKVVYDWDYENRLIMADVTSTNGTVQSKYKYNADGVRVASVVNGQETRYLIDTNLPHSQVVEEYSPNGSSQVSYVYGRDLISVNGGGVKTFYHVGGLVST